jgi:YHS domain-containing protein
VIQKIYEIVCDYCWAAIDHVFTMKEAKKKAMKYSYKGRHFCNETCKRKYLKGG